MRLLIDLLPPPHASMYMLILPTMSRFFLKGLLDEAANTASSLLSLCATAEESLLARNSLV